MLITRCIVNFIVLFVCVINKFGSCQGPVLTREAQLISHLLKGYIRNARPSQEAHKAVNVTIGLSVNRILQVNEKEQFITSRLWIRQEWKNELLTWNPREWDNITSIYVKPETVWVPDTVLYNALGSVFPGGLELYKTNVRLSSNGMQNWNSPAEIQSSCNFITKHFPFDQQSCFLKFGSWGFDQTEIDLYFKESGAITANFVENSEWQILSTKVERNVVKYVCCKYPFVDIQFHFVLKRKPMFYVLNLIVPCILLLPLMSITFYLPPESGERIGLAITILLAVSVFLQITSNSLPKNADHVPFIGIFFISIMVTSALSLVCTATVLIVHFKGDAGLDSTPPNWLKQIFLGRLARFLGVKDAEEIRRLHSQRELSDKSNTSDKTAEYDTLDNGAKETAFLTKASEKVKRMFGKPEGLEGGYLSRIIEKLSSMLCYIKERDRKDISNLEWKVIAKVLDKLIFVCFTLSELGILIIVFISVR